MASMTLQQAAQATAAVAVHGEAVFSAVSTDTRSIREGDLFVALQGPRFDGHDYLLQAMQAGAAGVMLSRAPAQDMPFIQVDDTRIAMGRLATAWREQVNPRVIALTGSNGKTTLKEMLAAVCGPLQKTLATRGNYNNDIGVPLTLLRLQDETLAIIEMGANHLGEIDYLSRMAKPDVAILNNAGTAHIGEFGSAENIARGKAEIIHGLKDNGTFVYHGDSRWLELWQQLAGTMRQVTFGTGANCDFRLLTDSYRLDWLDDGFRVSFSLMDRAAAEQYELSLPLAGRHNAVNAVAAAAAARQLDIGYQHIAEGLACLQPVRGRLQSLRGRAGQWIIDDSYNANPDSVSAAIDVLMTAPGRKVLVLGDLAELGEDEVRMHAELGELAQQRGIDLLLTCGPLSRHAGLAFGGESRHFEHQADLLEYLGVNSGHQDTLLFKGSRSAAMERLVDVLVKPREGSC